jgi:hypothetical protein
MNRATVLYVSLFGIAGLALWGVLTLGNRIKPPRDISGVWFVRGDTQDVESGSVVRISQSGRFFSVALADREPMEFRWTGEEAAADHHVVYLYNDRHVLTVSLRPVPDDPDVLEAAEFALEGAHAQVWRAERRGPEAPLPIEPRRDKRAAPG